MTAIWAYRGGQLWKPANGWDECIPFWTLGNLVSKMEEKKLKGRVTKLGIVAHGDRSGVVQFDRLLTTQTLDSFKSDIEKLRSFYSSYGKLIFFSCLSGLGVKGDEFLCALSKMLPGIAVVGFTVKNWAPGSIGGDNKLRFGDTVPTPAGWIVNASYQIRSDAAAYKGQPPVTEYDPTAKWSAVGWIVRPARNEVLYFQSLGEKDGTPVNSKKYCGSFKCPGHRSKGHWCRAYKRDVLTMKRAEESSGLIKQRHGGRDHPILLRNGKLSSVPRSVNTRTVRSARRHGIGASGGRSRTRGR